MRIRISYLFFLVFLGSVSATHLYTKKEKKPKMPIVKSYLPGFTTLNKELSYDNLEVQGTIPAWLGGTLFRCGPGKFEIGTHKIKHWFDGFGLLHRFTFNNGTVSYANRFTESEARRKSCKHGKVCFAGFADTPQKSFLARYFCQSPIL